MDPLPADQPGLPIFRHRRSIKVSDNYIGLSQHDKDMNIYVPSASHVNFFTFSAGLQKILIGESGSQFIKKSIMRMKLIILILTATCVYATASESNAQKVTLDFTSAPLEKILAEISAQSSYNVFGNKRLLRKALPVTVNLTNANLEDALRQCFAGQPFTYTLSSKDRAIVIQGRNFRLRSAGSSLSLRNEVQQTQVSGIVTDTAGAPLPGVSVFVKDTDNGVSTDENGQYTITIPSPEAVLVFRSVGFLAKEITVGGRAIIHVSLDSDIQMLNEMVVVGYGTQRRVNLTGSVASVNSREITVAPVASTTNTLAGRLPGLIALQADGRPGYDASSLSIRGFGSALVIVDGVESNFNNIDPNQIESISILKDGSASIYGSRAGNGVILIRTKRGNDQKPTVQLNSSFTLQGVTAMSRPVNAGQFAELRNEQAMNQGLPLPYTDEQVQKYYQGTDPLYPNTDWYRIAIRDWAPQQQHNVSIRGGNETVRFFGFFGYLDQESMWKNNGGEYSRYNLQSNIEASVTDNLEIQVLLSAVSDDQKYPARSQSPGSSSTWQDLWNTLPIYPASLPDPTKLSYANGAGTGGVPYSTNYDIIGYNKGARQNLKGQFTANYSFPWVKGLSGTALVNYTKEHFTGKAFNKPFNLYTYDPTNDTYTLAATFGTTASIREDRNQYQSVTTQLSLNYERAFDSDHYLKAMVLREAIEYKNDFLNAGRANFLTSSIEYIFGGSADQSSTGGFGTEMGRASYVGRLNYSYKDRYLLESSIRADASAQFPKEHRWGYFPSISLGWRISQEPFASELTGLDELKVRVSYGSSGQDNVSGFAYLSGYQINGQWLIGSGTQPGIATTGLANPLLTWEEIEIYNVGLDFSLWHSKLNGTFDAFYRNRSGIPGTRILSLPSTFGASLPPENINSQNTRGFELTLGTNIQFGDFNGEISGNISWSRSKWDEFEEPNYTDPDQIRINKLSGRWTDVQFGYRSAGLFTSESEIENMGYTYPGGNSGLGPGDIRYIDVNNDGVLDWKDQVDIGKGTFPHWMAGLNIRLGYRAFDMTALFQGAFDYYTNVRLDHGNLTYPREVYELRWHEANNVSSAKLPRVGGSSTNYTLFSDFFYKNASYLRLKTFSVGYNLPQQILSKAGLGSARLYFAGTNLLTFSKLFRDYNVDPEAPTNNAAFYYPQQKTITMGLNVSF